MTYVRPIKDIITGLSQPTRFLELADRVLPGLTIATILCLALGLYLSFVSDGDYQQGETVRIMYVHVPAAWMAMFCYVVMTVNATGSLVWHHPLADVAARAAVPIGAAFTFISLVTGAIWGKPMWGTWWVWDARLTSMFVLFLMYLGLLAINRAIDEPTRAARVTAVLIIVGFINIPIIKFSVDWWNTLHQPASVLRLNGPALDIEFLRPLLTMGLAFAALFFTLHVASIRNEIWRRKLMSHHRLAARAVAQREN
ncbi:heme exporter protein C [Rhizobium sp. BK529]|uniref:heme ABC transporter permease n=1 Tax=unclassified Rhizobium TaxID=2613769 RepID=UPI001048516F|nr:MULTISPECIES: heme ABC transporter permease [unclassified Rhizobium]MBB3593723.1 heme exporter protein C [Rhizobium sp. BK529]TCR94637.1 heme exporter protein C [Rhizobium sp. BK418]